MTQARLPMRQQRVQIGPARHRHPAALHATERDSPQQRTLSPSLEREEFEPFSSQDEFFFEDDKKTFLVTPAGKLQTPHLVMTLESVHPGSVQAFKKAVPYATLASTVHPGPAHHGPDIVDPGLPDAPGPLIPSMADEIGKLTLNVAEERY